MNHSVPEPVLHNEIPEDILRHFQQGVMTKRVILKDTVHGGFKILRLFDMSNSEEYSQYLQSVTIRNSISSPLIIPMLDNYTDKNNNLACISSVYYPFGNLNLFSEHEHLEPNCYLYIAKQLVKGVMHLHEKQICHGDIRLDNIYVRDIKRNKNAINDISIVLGSLYHAFLINDPPSSFDHYHANYLPVYAPETYQGQYICASDIYSIGICLYYLIESHFPFAINIPEEINDPNCYQLHSLFQNDIWKTLPPSFIDLISSMIHYNPQERITAEQAYLHPCFDSITSSRLNTQPASPYTVLGTTSKSKNWKVFMVRNNSTGDFLAVKKQENLTENRIAEFEKIYDILMKDPNENVLKPLEYWIEEEEETDQKGNTRNVRTLCTSTKCYAKSDLVRFMKNNRILFLPEAVLRQIAKELLLAAEYLHKKGLVHRNIKLEHIIVRKFRGLFDDISSISILLSGFGDVVFWKEGDEELTEPVGHPLYMAPEMREGHYTNKVDIWNIGVILYALVTRRFPYITKYSDTVQYDYSIPLSFSFGEHCYISSDFLNFISSLLTVDEKTRPSASEALQHPFLRS